MVMLAIGSVFHKPSGHIGADALITIAQKLGKPRKTHFEHPGRHPGILGRVKAATCLHDDRIQSLEARAIIDAVCAMFDRLLIDSVDQQRAALWLEKGVSDLSSIRPKPGR